MKRNAGILSAILAAAGINLITSHYEDTLIPVGSGFNSPPPFPTPGSNRKAAARRSGKQYRHGKAARK